MAAPAIVTSSADTTVETNGTSITITKPTGTVSGDLLLGFVAHDGGSGAITDPTGWTELHNLGSSGAKVKCQIAWLIAGGSEPADYTWSKSGGGETWCGKIFRISGHDGGTPIDTSAETQDAGTTTITCPTVTTGRDDCLVFMSFGQDDTGVPYTHPGGTTEVADFDSVNNPCALGICWFEHATAGATGTKDWTSGDTTESNAFTVSVQPPAGGATVPPLAMHYYRRMRNM